MPEFVSTIVIMHDRLPLNEWIVDSYMRTTEGQADHELVCVDNGSKDGTAEFLASQLKEGRVAKVLTMPRNVYLGPAWNTAATETVEPTVQLIGKIDNDSYFKPGWLKELRRVSAKSKADAIICTDVRADWRPIYKLRGKALEAAIKAGTTKGKWLHRPKDYGGSFYVRAKHVNDGLRMPSIKKMTRNSNTTFMAGLRVRKGRVVRLMPGFLTWEKIRYTDPRCGDYYDRTYAPRGLSKELQRRRRIEAARIAKGEIKLEYLNE